MWVQKFEVTGFLGRDKPLSAFFNRDLNILTGRNGAGKTSLLKLMWCIMSGNILEATKEVVFDKATLTTSDYICRDVKHDFKTLIDFSAAVEGPMMQRLYAWMGHRLAALN